MLTDRIVAAPGATAVDMIAHLLAERTGQHIAPSRSWRLETTLKPLMRAERLTTLDALVGALVTARDGLLADRVVDALLNQESSFFRDPAMFDLLAGALSAMARPGRRLRIWAAGCSTGQEALSLAMLCAEHGLSGAMVDIVATDVSHGAIARAAAGRYTQFEVQRGLSVHRMVRWFDGDERGWDAHADLLARVQYRRHNLFTEQPPAGLFDLILCRNVLLYFGAEQRAVAFARFAGALRPGGLLMLGASETVIGQTDSFRPSSAWRGLYRAVDDCKTGPAR